MSVQSNAMPNPVEPDEKKRRLRLVMQSLAWGVAKSIFHIVQIAVQQVPSRITAAMGPCSLMSHGILTWLFWKA